MKMLRQQLIVVVLAVLAFSCKENDKPSVSKPDVTKDTNNANITVNPNVAVNPYVALDVSPMDMSYYPVDYPKLRMASTTMGPPVMRVVYSRPHLGGRHLFDQLLKYGEPWRLGANESTEIQFFREVTIQDKKVKPGRYILYCIPQADKWTIILNSYIDSWGLKQEPTKDVQQFTIPVSHDHGGSSLEYFTLVFEKSETGANMIIAWGDVLAKLPINF